MINNIFRFSNNNNNNLTASHLQATLSNLLIYGVLRSTPPTLRGTGNE